MIIKKKLLAVITARGGSKRLPGKNTLNIAGKPMIAWSIEAALKSKYIDTVLVSTEDEVIADIARKFGAEVPFIRPKELASDSASSIDTIIHAINTLKKLKYGDYEYIILLQPTSPLRTFQHIDEAVELLLSKKAENIISICETGNLKMNPFPVYLDLNGKIYKKPNYPEVGLSDIHSNGKEYRINGAIYLSKISVLINEMSFLHGTSYAYLMDSSSSVDIDYFDDFKKCETIIKSRNSNI